jgi:hypothetical protein
MLMYWLQGSRDVSRRYCEAVQIDFVDATFGKIRQRQDDDAGLKREQPQGVRIAPRFPNRREVVVQGFRHEVGDFQPYRPHDIQGTAPAEAMN